MPPIVHRYSEYTAMPWKNGRGETREIGRYPATGEFAWRLSMATVAEDAAFSEFPGVTRTLAVVAGGELDLVVDGVGRRLSVGGPALTFSGEAPASAAPVTTTVTDLNLMVRAGFSGSIEPLDGSLIEAGAFVIAASTIAASIIAVSMITAGDTVLQPLDSLRLDVPLADYTGRGYVARIARA